MSVRQVVCQKDDLWDKNVENLLLSPPGPQLLLQELQLPQTPHWHSELDGGADGPAGVGIGTDGVDCNYLFVSYQHHYNVDNISTYYSVPMETILFQGRHILCEAKANHHLYLFKQRTIHPSNHFVRLYSMEDKSYWGGGGHHLLRFVRSILSCQERQHFLYMSKYAREIFNLSDYI